MASSCVYLVIPTAAAANQSPKISASSSSGSGSGSGRGMLNSCGISSAIYASASPRFGGIPRSRLFNQPITTSFRCYSQLAADIAPATAAAYGALLAAGGLYAYNRSGSKGSLIGGITGGSLMAAAYFLMQATDMKEIGEALALGSTLLFASVFGIRLAATRKITPAGPLLGLSICALVVFISAYLRESL